jgi:hypothetical protein
VNQLPTLNYEEGHNNFLIAVHDTGRTLRDSVVNYFCFVLTPDSSVYPVFSAPILIIKMFHNEIGAMPATL